MQSRARRSIEVTCQSASVQRQEVGQTSISSDGPELLAPSVVGSSLLSFAISGMLCVAAMATENEQDWKEEEEPKP